MNETTVFSSLVQYFFAQHLCAHKHVSPRTVSAYRDTFRLLLEFLQGRTGRAAASLQITDLDAPVILDFLEHLESERGNTSPGGLQACVSFWSACIPTKLTCYGR